MAVAKGKMNWRKELSIPSDLRYLKEVEIFVQGVLEAVEASEFMSGYVRLCVTECVNNAICHGNKQDLRKVVTIFAACEGDRLLIEVADEGSGFDFESLPDPTLDENLRKEGGRGLFIIRNLVDEIAFKRSGSVIQLKFRLKSEDQFLLRGRRRASSG